jgi:hydrogenase nickel incorporation protein HypA/HybF
MHELSIALEVSRIAQDYVGRDQLRKVVQLGMDVGEEAGVEVSSLEFCLEAVLTQPPFHNVRVVIRSVSGDVLRLSYLETEDGRSKN